MLCSLTQFPAIKQVYWFAVAATGKLHLFGYSVLRCQLGLDCCGLIKETLATTESKVHLSFFLIERWGAVGGRTGGNPGDLGFEVLISRMETKITTWLRASCGSQMNCKKLCIPVLCVLFHLQTVCYLLESDTVTEWEGQNFSGPEEMKGDGLEWSHLGQLLWDAGGPAVQLQPLWGTKEEFSWTQIIWDEVEAFSFPLTEMSTVPNCSMPTANVFSGYVFCS